MKIAKSLPEFLRFRSELSSKTLAFIPTMGNLHLGHLNLMNLGRQHADATMASIFVNPAQFAPHEDFDKYPRTFESDVQKLNSCGVSLLFSPPTTTELYPNNFITRVHMNSVQGAVNPLRNACGEVKSRWLDEQPESIKRPGFFDGVATVLTKLFNITRPNVVVFGQKDAVQCMVVKRLVEDLNFVDIKVVIGPIEREANGLAMSSRNQYLDPVDRKVFGPILYESLLKTKQKWQVKGLDSDSVKKIVESCYEELSSGFGKAMEKTKPQNKDKYGIEYVTMCDWESGQVLGSKFDSNGYLPGKNKIIGNIKEANISVVVRVGGTRLLDNIVLHG